MILELLDKQNSKVNTQIATTKLYPVDPVPTEIVVDNAFLRDGKFIFDLSFNNFDINEFDAIRIVPLNEAEVTTLSGGGLPNNLTNSDKSIIFGKGSDVKVYAPQTNIDNIVIDIKEFQENSFLLLVVLEDSPQENSDIFLISTVKSDLADLSSTKTETYKDVFTSKFSELTNLEIIEEKAYVSNLMYSCDQNGTLSGIFCVDKEKIINNLTKFPSTIGIDDNQLFSQLVPSIEICFYRYDKNENGYIFSDEMDCAMPIPVDNLVVGNKSGYRFYNFSIDLKDYYSDFQAVLKFKFNDITINLAKNAINVLKTIRDNDDRQVAASYLVSLYGSDVGEKFGFKISNLSKLSIIDFNYLMNKVIDELQKEIDNASQKVVVNTNIKSQYTEPRPSNSTFYRNYFTQKFEQKISLAGKKTNNFFGGLNTTNGFAEVPAIAFSTEDISIFAKSDKLFKVVKDKETIKKFKNISMKDKFLSNEGLQLKNNISDANQKLQNFLAQKQTEKFLSFVSNNKRTIKIHYLKFIGDSASALIFSEIDDDFPNFLSQSNKVLVRIDNYEEFYSSYLYVLGNQG